MSENTSDTLKNGHKYNFWMTPNALADDGHIALMGGSAFTVYAVLLRHSNISSNQCFPSYTTLQRKTGFSRPTVAKSIETLVELGYVSKVQVGNSTHNSTTYELVDLSLLPSPDLTSQESELVKNFNQPDESTSKNSLPVTSKNSLPALVKNFNSKETNLEKTNFVKKTKKNKEADFVSSGIRDLKGEALHEENINSEDKAKIQDPIPPTPLSHAIAAPKKTVKPLPSDPMGDRFRSGKSPNRFAPQGLELAGFGEWHLGGSSNNWRQSIIEAARGRKKVRNEKSEDSDCQDYIFNRATECYRAQHWGKFQNLVNEAIAIEEADRRLEAMNIEKPVNTVTYWYLWKAKPTEDGIFWFMSPQAEDASEEERKNLQIAVINALAIDLRDRGLTHLAIAGDKHRLHSKSSGKDLFPKMIQEYATCLQQLQETAA